jgi:hypothetical protein
MLSHFSERCLVNANWQITIAVKVGPLFHYRELGLIGLFPVITKRTGQLRIFAFNT